VKTNQNVMYNVILDLGRWASLDDEHIRETPLAPQFTPCRSGKAYKL